MTQTNIKNLPEGRYFTEVGYSQMYPWVVVGESKSGKTVTVARVEVDSDPEWKEKMEWHAGGFAGHCANQGQQTWLYAGVNEKVTKKVRMTKKGWASRGTRFIEGRATEFYDYNF